MSPRSIATDWQECKSAHDDAVLYSHIGAGWADKVTQGWRDHLAEKATAFQAKYGIEFNPHIPVDDSVQPATSERKGAHAA